MTSNIHESGIDVYALPQLIENTIQVLQKERRDGKITGGKIYQNCTILQAPENLAIIGDLHGDIQSLNQVLSEINMECFLNNPKNKLIFLGDYVDRGSDSVRVLCSICELKMRHPDSVILMRGNHEAVQLFPFPSHDLFDKVTQVFGDSSKVAYELILKFFQLLADVVIIEKKMLLVHGGLPVSTIPDNYDIMTLFDNNNHFLEEILWNDPRDIESWEISRRKFGKHFGKSTTKRWLDATNTCVIVRGHEPCHGFKIDHEGMILTIFSCKESYPAYDAGYLLIKNIQLDKIKNANDLSVFVKKIKKEEIGC